MAIVIRNKNTGQITSGVVFLFFRRFDAAPPPSPTTTMQATSNGEVRTTPLVQCRLCNAYHSADAECDCVVDSSFVYVSRSLRCHLAESMLTSGFNRNVNNAGGLRLSSTAYGSRSSSPPPAVSSSLPIQSQSAPVGSRSPRPTVNCLTVPCLQLPPSRDRSVSSGGSPLDFPDVSLTASSPRPTSRTRYRFQMQSVTAAATAVAAAASACGGQAAPVSQPTSNARYDQSVASLASNGPLQSSDPLHHSTSATSLPDFAVGRDLSRDFKLLGIRLFQTTPPTVTNDRGTGGGGAGFQYCNDCSGDLVNSTHYGGGATLPAVGSAGGSFYRESEMPTVTSARRVGSCIVSRRSDAVDAAAAAAAAGSNFPYYRKMALVVHPDSSNATAVGNVSRPVTATAKNLRLHCNGRAACWTALPIGEWKSHKKRPRTAIIWR